MQTTFPKAIGFDNGRNYFWFCSEACAIAHCGRDSLSDLEDRKYPLNEKCIQCGQRLKTVPAIAQEKQDTGE